MEHIIIITIQYKFINEWTITFTNACITPGWLAIIDWFRLCLCDNATIQRQLQYLAASELLQSMDRMPIRSS